MSTTNAVPRRRVARALAGSDRLDTDVLVLGGGPAGTWAAIAAAEAGARVVLADKGYCGTSGAAAAGGNNLWYLPEGAVRQQAIEQREQQGGHLSDRAWMERTLALTWQAVDRLDAWGYPFPTDRHGEVRRSSLQGPAYMRLMRRQVLRAGVTVLDQCPALELLTDADGVVSGAAGVQRQHGNRPWTVTAGAVVVATGGCAFLSGALGCNTDTGDGQLMAAEVGAELSGMEFSSCYAMAPAFGAQTKGRIFQVARYYAEDGELLDIPAGFAGRAEVARLLRDQRVQARLDLAPPALREALRDAQPNFFLPFDKAGIDPFTDLFGIRLVLEGTVRGTGGLAIDGPGCETTVPGLFAAGDAATRELVTGGVSGGGSHNGAWAIASGSLSGEAAARFSRRPRSEGTAAGGHGLGAGAVDPAEVVRAVQAEVVPLEKNLHRVGPVLTEALRRLDGVWADAVPALDGGANPQRAREAAAMTAHARWMYAAALARPESRGMHQREDHPGSAANLARRLRVSGLDTVRTHPEPVLVTPEGMAS